MWRLWFTLSLLLLVLSNSLRADEPGKNFWPLRIKGRRMAQTMHWLGEEWLVRDEHEREERCSLMIATLGLKPGMTVCDMGCGNGFYSVQLAKMVGPKGKAPYAVDIQPEMLKFLKERADKDKVTNIEPVLGKLWDPNLPEGKIDLILLVDVYHEFSHPDNARRHAQIACSRRPDRARGVSRRRSPKCRSKSSTK